jgi:Skp family chaperone for outer membrane proteins
VRVVNRLAVPALLVIGSAFCGNLPAQSAGGQSAAASQGTRIAVVDVGFIVKNHPTMKTQQAGFRDQVKNAQDELVKRKQSIVAEAEKLKSYTEGSPDFNQHQEKLANLEAQLKLDTVRREKDLADLEAKMALDFYVQLQGLISQLAEFNQIDLVLRTSNEKPDIKVPATIQMALENEVVYSRPSLDLTGSVLSMLQSQAGMTPTPNGATNNQAGNPLPTRR